MEQRRSELLDHQPSNLLDELEAHGFANLSGAIHCIRIKTQAMCMLIRGSHGHPEDLERRAMIDAVLAIHASVDDADTLADALVDLHAPERRMPRSSDRRYFAEPEHDDDPEDEG